MNNTTTIDSTDQNAPVISGFTYGIIFTIGMVFLILTILFACARFRLPANIFRRRNSVQPTTAAGGQQFVEAAEQGLDDAILGSYPKLLYSEVQQRGSALDSSCCSICLLDYKETDVLRMLPDCDHLYHLSCIDSWLKLHPTCPICRNSPVRALQSNTSTEYQMNIRVE